MVIGEDDAYERQFMSEGEEADLLERLELSLYGEWVEGAIVNNAAQFDLNTDEWSTAAKIVKESATFRECLHDALTDHSRYNLDYPLQRIVAGYLLSLRKLARSQASGKHMHAYNAMSEMQTAERDLGALLLPLICDYLARIDI